MTTTTQATPGVTLSLTQITATGWTPREHGQYRCNLTLLRDDDILSVKELYPRHLPDWIVRVSHPQANRILLTLYVQEPEQNQRVLGVARFHLDGCEPGAVTLDCDDQSQLKFWLYLENHPRPARALSLRCLGRLQRRPYVHQEIPTEPDWQLPQSEVVSARDLVLIQNLWSRLERHPDLIRDAFGKCLLSQDPWLLDTLLETQTIQLARLLEIIELCAQGRVDGTNPHVRHFLQMGFGPRQWQAVGRAWVETLVELPNLSATEKEDLQQVDESAAWRGITQRLLIPVAEAWRQLTPLTRPDAVTELRDSVRRLVTDKPKLLAYFATFLREQHPASCRVFDRLGSDLPGLHLFHALDFTAEVASNPKWLEESDRLGKMLVRLGVPKIAFKPMAEVLRGLPKAFDPQFSERLDRIWQFHLERVIARLTLMAEFHGMQLQAAQGFVKQYAQETGAALDERANEIAGRLRLGRAFELTKDELTFGARLAWRNAARCIGRLFWDQLIVRDCRHLTHPDDMAAALLEHLRCANNGGRIQSVATVFRPRRPKELWGIRIWNPQLISYAGYSDGLGDGVNRELTQAIMDLGWQPPGERSRFDVLPLVLDAPGFGPCWYPVPEDLVLEVAIQHPRYPALAALDMRWYGVPAISNFRLDLAGQDFTCVPFNGWYMVTEIARDLTEPERYDMLAKIAVSMGLKPKGNRSLWRDEAMLALNQAILESYTAAGVTLVDHHTAAKQFLAFDRREKELGRDVAADWSWIMPPAGGTACPVYHHEMREFPVDTAYRPAMSRVDMGKW